MLREDKLALRAGSLPEGIVAAEVTRGWHDETSLQIEDGEQSSCRSFLGSSVLVLVESGASTGRVSSTDPFAEIRPLLQEAAENAKYSSGKGVITKGEPISVKPPKNGLTVSDLRNFGVELEKAASAIPGLVSVTSCRARMRTLGYETANTLGSDDHYEEFSLTGSIGVEMSSGAGKRWSSGISVSADTLDDLDPGIIAAKVAAKAHLVYGGSLEKRMPPAGKYRTVITSDVASSIMLKAWMGIAGANVARRSPIYPFDPSTVICYERRVPDTWANGVHESLGTSATVDGHLMTPVNLRGDVKMVSTPSRLFIEPSDTSPEDLLAAMGDGLFVTTAFDVIHSIQDSNGDFAIICDGIIYEKGKPRWAFERALMHGNMQNFFANLRTSGDDPGLHQFLQSVYAYGSPTVFLEDVAFGGEVN